MGNVNSPESLDINYLLGFLKKHWLVIGACVCISLFFVFVVNEYSAEVYSVRTAVVINEESGGLAEASAQLLNEFGFISNNKSFANELLVLKSTPLVARTIKKLDFQISYFEQELLYDKELYKSSPFIVILDKNYPQPIGTRFHLDIIDSTKCKIRVEQENVGIYSFASGTFVQDIGKVAFEEILEFDHYLYSDYMKFKILLNSSVSIKELKAKNYSFQINTPRSLVRSYRSRLEVLPPDLEATVAEIKLETKNPEKAIDFLDALMDSYISMELDRKKHTSIRTIEYINDQLEIVGDSLERAEQNLQYFRTQNEVTDISIQSGQFFEEMRELESQKAILDVNSKYYQYIKNYFKQNDELDELITPSAMGIDDPMLNNLIEELIRLNGERASFIENNQAKSPYLKKINIRIENLRKMVTENISYYEETNSIKLDDLNSRIRRLNNEMRKLPATERALVGIERKFNINDAIYTYLLEKRAEAEIAKASYQADTEIMEPAAIEGNGPISPKKKMNYIIGFILGLIVPVSIFRALEFTRISFFSVNEVENIVKLPILGRIYHHNKDCENVVENFPHSHVAENFRHLHIGLKYFFKNEQCKTVLITSAIGGEGKTFAALNSAYTIANSGFKTILLAFDIRKPRLSDFLSGNYKADKEKGLTEYISGQANIDDIINNTHNTNLDFALSGQLAPNPGELLSSEQTGVLFNELKKRYEYIIVDASPIGLVSDAYNILTYCDLSVLLVRLKVTPKSEFNLLQLDLIDKGIKSCVILNDITRQNGKGYGYYHDKRVEN